MAHELHHVERHPPLLQGVEERGLGEHGIVALVADHGESLGENDFWFAHGEYLDDPLVRVPFMIARPGAPAGTREDVVGLVDLMPTLLEPAGLEPDPDARGIALGPYLRSDEPLPDRTLICDMGSELAAYRGDGFVRLVEITPALLERSKGAFEDPESA